MRLILIRHGQSVGNQRRLIFGSADHPLTDSGRNDARIVSEKIRDIHIDCCYASPLIRAYETAEICFSGSSVPIICDDGLREQFMGEFENGEYPDLMARFPKEFGGMMQNWTVCPPVGGEAFDDMYSRVTASVDRIISKGQDAAVVAHNGSLSIITAYLLGTGKQSVEAFYHMHGCFSSIIIGEGYRPGLNTLEFFNR